jgi:hypothetical protein
MNCIVKSVVLVAGLAIVGCNCASPEAPPQLKHIEGIIRQKESVLRRESRMRLLEAAATELVTNVLTIARVNGVEGLFSRVRTFYYSVELVTLDLPNPAYIEYYTVAWREGGYVEFIDSDEKACREVTRYAQEKGRSLDSIMVSIRFFGLLRGYTLIAPDPYGVEPYVRPSPSEEDKGLWKVVIGQSNTVVNVDVTFKVTRDIPPVELCPREFYRYRFMVAPDGAIAVAKGRMVYCDNMGL